MLFSKRSLLAWAVASLAFILPQASAQCNPLTSTCPPNPGLTKRDFYVDFTKVSSLPEGWTLANYATVKYGANGAEFTFNKRFEAPYIWTSFYILFGRVEVVMQAAPGIGMISSAVLMSDDQDEIDWEWSGNNFGHNTGKVQTNYFGKGITGYWDRGTQPDMDDPINKFHTYTFDWSPTTLTWAIDGQVIRTLKAADTNSGAYQYPQSPSKLHLGVWCAGDPNSHPNTVSWAGGYTDFTKAPFTAYVKSVKISNANPCSQYEYGDKSGSWQSIKCLNTTSTPTSSSSIASTSSSTSSSLSSITSATSRSSSLSPSISSIASSSSSSLSSAVSSAVSSRSSSLASSSTSASIPASFSASPAASPSYPNSGPVFDPLHPDPALVNKTGPGTFNFTSKSVSSSSSSSTLTSKSSGSGTQGVVSSSTASPLPSPSSPSPAPIQPTTSTSPPPNQQPSKKVPTSSSPTTTPTSNTPTSPTVPFTTPASRPAITPSPSPSPSSPKPTTTATSSGTAAALTPPKCHPDNCLRALRNTRYAGAATALCRSFTNTGTVTATPTATIGTTNGVIKTSTTSTTPPNSAKTALAPTPTPTSSTTLSIPTWLSTGCSNNATRAGVGTVEGVRKAILRAGFGDRHDDEEEEDDDDGDDGSRDGSGRWSGNAKFGSRYAKAKAMAKGDSEKEKKDADNHQSGWLYRRRVAGWAGLVG
ncbi:hypothetical protein EPUS_02987 [Endocarpon pusillum Z07020]|uniref:GH16 domain-containing protein n=1 Tax=Endocarpon pusillum (strain Z07020 / HMAS-L-300199) TaxID=1263415 RepID=U1GMN8_ENDPU|nr:uncharacterized protein EPUS_02987 [Endocarpon pusillum Z07020]ERF73146.1 hypothetical protein EPUS_02987 [Endocarpon pusillum Z07020]